MVGLKESASGNVKYFRIQDVATDDDVSAVALASLLSNRDVNISYETTVTTGCGSEPRILFITIF